MAAVLEANPDTQAIRDAVAALRQPAVDLLLKLVAEPSLLGDEASAQALMSRHFAGLGLRVDEFEIDEDKIRDHPGYSPSIVPYAGRRNVVGVHQPKGPVRGRSLILNGHIDVVPVGAARLWSQPPFEPKVDGDKLYGRGAGDMKAGIVAYCMAFEALRRLGFEPAAPVFLQSVIEEECTGNGALSCLLQGYSADAALIPEPIPGIMTGQMGVMWVGIEVLGMPVHAAVAQTGVAAIEFAQYLCAKLKELEAQWNEPANRHPHYAHHDHPINFNIGKLSGGEWASSVATQCRADVRIGFYPGMKPAQVRALVEAVVRAAYEAHPKKASVRYELHLRRLPGRGHAGRHEPADDRHAHGLPPRRGRRSDAADRQHRHHRCALLPALRRHSRHLLRPGFRQHPRHRRMGVDRQHDGSDAGAGAVHGALVRAERALINRCARPGSRARASTR